MKKIIFLFLTLLLVYENQLSAQNSLGYKWKAGTVYKFKSTQNDHIKMGGGGMMGMMAMAGDMQFKTESTFALKIDQLLGGGSASGSFYLIDFKVSDDKGNVMATLASLPTKAIEADFTVDKKGNFTFTEIPVLVCRESGNLLVSTKVEKGEMAASAEADGERVTLFAEFNPKTGTLKAGYSTATIAKPKPKPVTIKEDDETIDLLPSDFLDLLVLPEGPVAAGQNMKTRMYDTEITQKVLSFTGGIAEMNFDIKSALDSRKFEKDAKKMAGDEEEKGEEMKMDMDMGGMGMPGIEGDGQTPQFNQEMDGDINLSFDNNKGMIRKMEGTINTKMNMMGMEMTQKSTVFMDPIP
jgi:hypothetical protein